MSGRRRHLVTFQKREESLDAYGEASLSYRDLAQAWGSIVAVSATERLRSQQVEADVTHRLTVPFSEAYATITPADRVKFGTRVFDIESAIDPDERRRTFVVTMREVL